MHIFFAVLHSAYARLSSACLLLLAQEFPSGINKFDLITSHLIQSASMFNLAVSTRHLAVSTFQLVVSTFSLAS